MVRSTGGLVNFGKFAFDPESTIADITGAVCAKWNLNPGEIEFGRWDGEHDPVLVSPTTKLSEVYVDENLLQVGLTGQFLRGDPVATPPVESARLSMSGNFLRIWFKEISKNDRFNLPFQKTDTVRTAREEVRKRLGLDSVEFITLLFGGKPLADNFILGRLRLGDSDISVYVKDLNEVVLLTGKALI
jgi:hypothetical protein